ncbi:hypothetical protein AOQ73_20660 [Bradyrhizobium pachyrhizi]|uniref:hypothetical protein n=1 Tax=Bradyrhizobium pachyrhizi TaxID=280333 RepID=UPI0007052F1B|nr:hypothetical protein [Bradyrhizobium pachyrhizi]KRP98729.1 hypothetical protein AOQ73_20660 [Bradyrhizobium pachyrhizi]
MTDHEFITRQGLPADDVEQVVRKLFEQREQPFFVGDCYSWRLGGPVVPETFPQFAQKLVEVKQGS